jgi:hypothetical protein
MERFLGWRGLLVEAAPVNVALVKKVNRKAWLAPTCLSIKPYPVMVQYYILIAHYYNFYKLICFYEK